MFPYLCYRHGVDCRSPDVFGTLLGSAILIGFGNGVGSGIMMTIGADLAPKDGTGEFLGMWRLLGDFGGAAGHLVVGNVADLWGLGTSGYVLAGIGYIAVLFFLRVVPENLECRTANRVTGRQIWRDSIQRVSSSDDCILHTAENCVFLSVWR